MKYNNSLRVGGYNTEEEEGIYNTPLCATIRNYWKYKRDIIMIIGNTL